MFERVEMFLGKENLEQLKSKKVLVIGLGGVGGYVVESLVRTGIMNIGIVDFDKVELSNFNRQIIAIDSNLNKLKTDAFKERILSINKSANVTCYSLFLDNSNISDVINGYDYVIDACDSIKTKCDIITYCLDNSIPFITSCGTAKKKDPKKLEITELSKTKYDPLAKLLRKYVKDNNIKDKIMVLSSSEDVSSFEGKDLPSLVFVPSIAGILIADYVIKQLLS